jgi:hypothetical protein
MDSLLGLQPGIHTQNKTLIVSIVVDSSFIHQREQKKKKGKTASDDSYELRVTSIKKTI